jgi:hypothetical protein
MSTIERRRKKDKTCIIKWVSASLILIAMVFHVLGLTPWNSILQLVAASGWTYVGIKVERTFDCNEFSSTISYHHSGINLFVIF